MARAVAAAFLAALLAALVPAAPAGAVPTKAFRQTTAKDFEEGEATGSTVLPTGEVISGMSAGRLGAEAAFVWCAAASRDGATAYFGTGDEGKIFAVGPGAPGDAGPGAASASGGKAGGAVRLLADLDVAWVTALAVRPDGTLLAGTTPEGRIFRVDPRSGAAKEWSRLGTDHVWSLVHDPKTGITYAGSGPGGKIYAVDGAGKPRVLWDSGDKHVVSLLLSDDGTLLAGTSEEAIVYRVRPDGHATAVHDFEAEEVRAIARHKGVVYLAVNEFEKPVAPAGPPQPPSPKGTKIVLSSGGPPASAGSLPRPGQRKAKGGIYRLDPDGRIEQVHALGDGYFTAVLVDGQGSVYAASGTQGKVYRILPDRTVSLTLDLPERQALSLTAARDGLLVGTGDVGGVYRARPAAKDASYLSKVLDAEAPARWGMVRWKGSKGLVFETRSGSTAKPDASWSEWKRLAGGGASGDGGSGYVASPGARYIQYRVGLGGDGALRDMALYYLPLNQRARIVEMTVNEAAAGSAGATTTTPSPRAHSSVAKLRWKVENPDGDELVFRLSFRPDGDPVWRPLGGPDPLTKPELDWNTESVPDGVYVVRVVTSDERANPRERALDSTFVSPPILVDNRKPEVTGLEVRFPMVAGRARDEAGNITEIEFSVDGGEWSPVAPTDGILDDYVEPFSFRLPALASGAHAVTVRAWDSADNVGSAQITVKAK